MRQAAELLTRLGMSHHSISVDSTPHSSQASAYDMNDSPAFSINALQDSSEIEETLPPSKKAKLSHEESVHINKSSDNATPSDDPGDKVLDQDYLDFKMVVGKSCNICPECNERVENRNIIRHIRENHTDKRFPCKECGNSYQRREYLDKHICKHDKSVSPYECEECEKRFPTEAKLISHKKYKSKTCPRFKCSHCETESQI